MTPSEKFVFDLCNNSFLPFWSFANPIGKKGNELCDVLVICGDIIIIISVKDIKVSYAPDEIIQYERWIRKAIHASIDQIVGAEKFILSNDRILLKDKVIWIDLPPKESRKIFRIAVAFGSKKNFPLPTGDFGNGFVHVFDEDSTVTIINELDTITDFVNYLSAKERIWTDKTIFAVREVDFLGVYIQTQFEFIKDPSHIVLDGEIWDDYVRSNEYHEWRDEIKISFIWDNIINRIYDYHIKETTTNFKQLELEEALRLINLEPRVNRIELGKILKNANDNGIKARMTMPLEGSSHCYVFLFPDEKNWNHKEQELAMRCHIARAANPTDQKVIGIAIGTYNNENWFDILYLDVPNVDTAFIKLADDLKKEFGYFRNIKFTHSRDILL